MVHVSRRMPEFMSPHQLLTVRVFSTAAHAYRQFRQTCRPMVKLRFEDHVFLLKKILADHQSYPRIQRAQRSFCVQVSTHEVRKKCDEYGLCWRCHIIPAATAAANPHLGTVIHLVHNGEGDTSIDHDVTCPKWKTCQWCGIVGPSHEWQCTLRPKRCQYCDTFVPLPYLNGHESHCSHKCTETDCRGKAMLPMINLCLAHRRKKFYRQLVQKAKF